MLAGSFQAAATKTARRIDAHTHFASLRFLDFAERHEGKSFILSEMYRRKPALTDGKARLRLLDQNEVDIHVLVPVPWLEAFPSIANDPALAMQAAQLINDEIADVVAAYPQRFRGVAILPTVDPDAMVAELRRAINELNFIGGYVPVGPTVKRMDHPDYDELYKTITELDATLWLHPSRPPMPDYIDEETSQYQVWRTFGWPLDTTAAMHRIVFSGVFDRFLGIRIVTHHHGGLVPYYAPRMVGGWDQFEELGTSIATNISKPYIDHFKKFYCDTACNEYAPKVLELALDFFGPQRVLFGTDAPFGVGDGQIYIAQSLRSVMDMQISPEIRNRILAGNAMRILQSV